MGETKTESLRKRCRRAGQRMWSVPVSRTCSAGTLTSDALPPALHSETRRAGAADTALGEADVRLGRLPSEMSGADPPRGLQAR